MLSRIPGFERVSEVIDSVRRKQSIFKSEMKVGDDLLQLKESSHLVMKDARLYIQEIKTVIADEYYTVKFDNGEYIHYDYFGKAYLSLDPTSKLYKIRLCRYDITNII